MHVEIVQVLIIGMHSKRIGDKMTIEERYYRIDSAPYIVFPDDRTIHTVENIEVFSNTILVETDTGWLFNDMDVFTIDEMVDVENKLEELLK
jgi:hypothetical protein